LSEFRFVTSSDEHLADLNPGFRKDEYRNAIFRKLEWQGKFAKKFGADALLRGGDFFHVRAANKTTMATLAEAARIHRRYPCRTYALAGNHDMCYGDPDTVAKQPLGVMIESKSFWPLRDEYFIHGSMRVRVIGIEYTPDLDYDGLASMIQKKDGDTYTIAFVHALAANSPEKKTEAFFGERIFDYRDLVFQGCPDVYIFGHYHKDQGIQEHLGVQFVNLGAISRGALTFENLNRVPKISSIICSSQGISIEEHIVPHDDASEVFDLERKQQLDKERRSIDSFLEKLKMNAQLSSDGGVKDYLAKFQKSDYPADLKRVVVETLEAAEVGVLEE